MFFGLGEATVRATAVPGAEAIRETCDNAALERFEGTWIETGMTAEKPTGDAEPSESREQLRQRIRESLREHEELALWMRALLFLVGWLLVLLGIAGLVLPGIQGILTLMAGAAVLSLASEIAYKVLRWSFQRWPRGWRRVHRWRSKLRRKLVKLGGRRRRPTGGPSPGDDEECR
jgi:hypothetical protein